MFKKTKSLKFLVKVLLVHTKTKKHYDLHGCIEFVIKFVDMVQSVSSEMKRLFLRTQSLMFF